MSASTPKPTLGYGAIHADGQLALHQLRKPAGIYTVPVVIMSMEQHDALQAAAAAVPTPRELEMEQVRLAIARGEERRLELERGLATARATARRISTDLFALRRKQGARADELMRQVLADAGNHPQKEDHADV